MSYNFNKQKRINMNTTIETGSRFLASTMHEVRTPIQTIISTTELLSETSLNKEQLEYVRQIEFSANVLLQLANDILDYTKITSSIFQLENIPFDVIELTESVVDLISIEGFSKHLEIITNIDYFLPKIVTGDPTRVQQILLNLAKNAVKFTENGYVQISLRKVNNQLYFEVMDSGIGVSKEKQALIFNSFYQVDASTTRRYGGTGLGLSICKNLVDLMHGEIGMRENPSGGSIFYFTLPLESSDFNPDKNLKLSLPASAKILIVDDNSLSLLSLTEKMKSIGFKNIETAASGKDALSKLKSAVQEGQPYSLALIDMIMPEMDGWRLAAEISNDTFINDLKLYLMVPEGQMGAAAKMKLLNWFNGYIYKPIKRTALLNILEEAFYQPFDLQPIENEKQENQFQFSSESFEHQKNMDNELASDLKILIAEDHPVNRKIMETFLQNFGASVFSAEDGEAAIQIIQDNPDIDMIFMDILMPIKSGLDATIELRKMKYKGVIIACTANSDSNDFAEYRRQGINDIIVKPFKKDLIRATLEKWNTILSVPEAKQILTMTTLKNSVENFWDVSLFLESVNNNDKKAKEKLENFFDQTELILRTIRNNLDKPDIDFSNIENQAKHLLSNSSSINAITLLRISTEILDAAREKNKVAVEASHMNFSLDFVRLKNVSENWRDSIQG